MTIEKSRIDDILTINLDGRLDTLTAPDLEKELKASLAGVRSLVFGFDRLEYISSAGLRVILSAQKIMNKQGSMVIRGANELVRSVFAVTGMDSIVTFE